MTENVPSQAGKKGDGKPDGKKNLDPPPGQPGKLPPGITPEQAEKAKAAMEARSLSSDNFALLKQLH